MPKISYIILTFHNLIFAKGKKEILKISTLDEEDHLLETHIQ